MTSQRVERTWICTGGSGANGLTLSVSFKVRDEQKLQIRLLCGGVVVRSLTDKWKQKHTSFRWKPLCTNHKWPHLFTLIVFLHENELFQRGWGVFVTLVEIPEGWGGYQFPAKMENPGRWGVLSEIPSMVGVWIFSGTAHYIENR